MTTAVRERPILFCDEMVRAILDGRKTQTRRILRVQPLEILTPRDKRAKSLERVTRKWNGCRVWFGLTHRGERIEDNRGTAFRCKFGEVGDRLWVRETFIDGYPTDAGDLLQYDEDGNELPRHVWYRADLMPEDGWISNRGAKISAWMDEDGLHKDNIPWKPSIHMPRWASRLTLELTDVRVQRLQEISEEDAIAEGFGPGFVPAPHPQFPDMMTTACVGYRPLFARKWDEINGAGSRESNPWVWALSFKRVPVE